MKNHRVDGVTIKDITPNPYDEDSIVPISYRDNDVENNIVSDFTIDYVGSGVMPTVIVAGEDSTLKDGIIRSPDSGNIVQASRGSSGSTIENVRAVLAENTADETTVCFRISDSNVSVRNCEAIEETEDGIGRAYSVSPGDDNPVNDVATTDSLADCGDFAWRHNGPVNRLWTSNITYGQSDTSYVTNAVWWAENQFAREQADAEGPQGDYADGTIVQFVDEEDGSGTGQYLITRTEGAVVL